MAGDLESGSSDTVRLEGILQEAVETSSSCGICHEALEDPVIARCEHVFCISWSVNRLSHCIHITSTDNFAKFSISEHLENISRCPKCNNYADMQDLVAPRSEAEISASAEDEVLAQQAVDGMGGAMKAAKTEVLIGHLQATEPTVKSLVFSQVRSSSLLVDETRLIVVCTHSGLRISTSSRLLSRKLESSPAGPSIRYSISRISLIPVVAQVRR